MTKSMTFITHALFYSCIYQYPTTFTFLSTTRSLTRPLDKQADILRSSLVVFVTSTTGQGDMPKNTLKFWKNLRREKLNNTNCLRSLRFAIFGLGDSSYPKYAPLTTARLIHTLYAITCSEMAVPRRCVLFYFDTVADQFLWCRFNWAARKLRARLLQLGATEFFRPGEGDERHDNG